MIDDKPNYGAVTAAAVIASVLVLVLGLSHRFLNAWLRLPMVANALIAPDLLGRLPTRIGEWTGEEVPLDETLVRNADIGVYINRRYSHAGGSQSVLLYVTCGNNARQVTNHRPDICYVAAGMPLIERRSLELSLHDGTKLPCSIFAFFRRGLDGERVMVVDYFLVDGQYCDDFRTVLMDAKRHPTTHRYVAQVQVVAAAEILSVESAMRLVSTFAVDSAPAIAQLFENVEEGQSPEGIRDQAKDK